jgi:hydrogenase expression/formation protein HypD
VLTEVFEVCDRQWRGIGMIPQSGWRLSERYRDYDAEYRFDVADLQVQESPLCRSGEVLQGLIKPNECEQFGIDLHPAQPAGGDDGLLRGCLRGLLPVPPARSGGEGVT